jgi:hypothetical protein
MPYYVVVCPSLVWITPALPVLSGLVGIPVVLTGLPCLVPVCGHGGALVSYAPPSPAEGLDAWGVGLPMHLAPLGA